MKRVLILFFCIFINIKPVFSLTYEELQHPASPATRMGIGSEAEKEFKTVDNKTKTAKSEGSNKNTALTYADLSLKKTATEIADDLTYESPEVLADLAVLWNAAAQKSETVKFTIYKLSNPDEDKPKENIVKRIVKPIAGFSSIAGTAFTGNPFAAAGALIGGNLLGAISADDSEVNYRFSKVNDADMVLLVRKIDELQNSIVLLYYDYITSKEIAKRADKSLDKRYQIYRAAQKLSRESIIVADAYYRMAQDSAKKAQADYWAKRSSLEQLVGAQALYEIENKPKEK